MTPVYGASPYDEQRRRDEAAKLYVESQRRRDLFQKGREAREDDAVIRAREDRERWERQRALDEMKREKVRAERELNDLSREAERKRSEVDALKRRESTRYEPSYVQRDRYVPTNDVRDRARRNTTELYRERWRV